MNIFESKFFVFWIFVALAFLLFGNGINGDFVFDDRSVIVGHPLVENLSGTFKAFLHPYHYDRPQSGLYRPLTSVSYTLNWHLFSGQSYGFHLVNIFLHALVSFVIFLSVLNLSNKLTAWISSLLFLFLPIHVEAVTSVVGRGELLMSLFFILAFYLVQKRHYKTVSLYFFLSLLSKETGIAFVPVFIFFEFFWRKTLLRELLKKTSYFLPPLIVYSGLRYKALGFEYFLNNEAYAFFNPILEMDFLPGLWTAFKVLYLYIQKTIFLTYFSSDYSYNQITAVNNLFDSWQAIAGILTFASVIYLSTSKRKSLIGLGAFIFLISYLIVSNLFIKTGTIMGERLMYLPSLGIVMIIAAVIENLKFKVKSHPFDGFNKLTVVRNSNHKLRVISLSKDSFKFKIFNLPLPLLTLHFLLLTLLVWYGYLIIDRNKDWLNEKNLFTSAYEVAPNSVVNITNMASILFREGKNDEALEKIKTALKIEPKNSPTLHLAGQIYKKMGENKVAEEFWLKAIQAQPDYLYPYLSLGALYYQKGDFKSGETILFKAKETYDTPNAIILLALNQIGLEKYSEAINLIEEKFGKKIKEYEPRFILGVAYLKSENNQKAKELLLELKDPALTEEEFLQNLKNKKIFDVEI